MKTIENSCIEKYQDLSIDRIRRMIRSVLKGRKSQLTNHKKNRSNLNSTNKSVGSIEWSDDDDEYFSFLVGFSSITDIDINGIWCWFSSSSIYSTISTIIRSLDVLFYAIQRQQFSFLSLPSKFYVIEFSSNINQSYISCSATSAYSDLIIIVTFS